MTRRPSSNTAPAKRAASSSTASNARAAAPQSGPADAACNIAVVRGNLSRTPEERTLPSGDRLVSLDVSVAGFGGRLESVPVAWPDPPATAADLAAGDDVVVVGRVRRRFFRAGGSTQSRTEVVASAVLPPRRRAKVRAAVAAAVQALDELTG